MRKKRTYRQRRSVDKVIEAVHLFDKQEEIPQQPKPQIRKNTSIQTEMIDSLYEKCQEMVKLTGEVKASEHQIQDILHKSKSSEADMRLLAEDLMKKPLFEALSIWVNPSDSESLCKKYPVLMGIAYDTCERFYELYGLSKLTREQIDEILEATSL